MTIFTDASTPSGGFPDFRNLVPKRPHDPHQLLGTRGSFPGSTTLGSSVTDPLGVECYRKYYGSVLYQQAGGWGEIRTYSLLQLVVHLFLWLHSQDNNSSSPTCTRLPQSDRRPCPGLSSRSTCNGVSIPT